MIADISALVLLIISVWHGRKKGFVNMIGRTLFFVAALAILYLGFQPVYQAVQQWQPYIKLETTVSSHVSDAILQRTDKQYSSTQEAISSLKFPKPMAQFLEDYCRQINDVIAEDISVTVTSAITELSMRIIIGFALFVAAILLIAIGKKVLNAICHLPIIHGTNKLLGGIFGLINGLIILYIIGFIILALPINSTIWFQQYLNGSLFKTWIYDHNVLTYFVKLLRK